MKRCKVCNRLTDNGDMRCPKCGSPYPYDPKVTPFSETKIALAVIFLVAVGLLVARALPVKMPDSPECTRVSVNRFKRIVARSHNEIMFILAENYISSKHLSTIIQTKRAAEEMVVPACLEAAKADYVSYLDALYWTAMPSAWGAYEYAAYYAEQAVGYMKAIQEDLKEVKECLPDCP
jgi:hypothetical protein